MNVQDLVARRQATKLFDERPLPVGKLDVLCELIRLAPTSFNLQPWHALIVTDNEQKQLLRAASWDQPQITSCAHLLVFCANTALEELADRLESRMRETPANPAEVSAYVGMVRTWIDDLGPDRLGWAQRQTYLALGHGLIGATSLGFDSCPMEGFSPEAYSKVLELPEHLVPTVLLPVGYAADPALRPKIRFTHDELFTTVGPLASLSSGATATADL